MKKSDLIKECVTIFQVMDKLGLPYDFKGTHQISCPFHDDAHKSARVYEDTNKIWCWTCGKAWDVIELVVEMTNLNFKQTLIWLEQEFSLVVPTEKKVSKFYSLARKKPKVGNCRLVAEEAFISFCKQFYYKSELLAERIDYCWLVFDQFIGNSYQDTQNWLSSSKNIVRDAYSVQRGVWLLEKGLLNTIYP
jgi:DNA primase